MEENNPEINPLEKENDPNGSLEPVKKINKNIVSLSLLLLVVIFLSLFEYKKEFILNIFRKGLNNSVSPKTELPIKKFSSKEEFISYIKEADLLTQGSGVGMSVDMGISSIEPQLVAPTQELSNLKDKSQPERVSSTNVQVSGLDEPDIVKTDGDNIFISKIQNLYFELPQLEVGRISESKMAPIGSSSKTAIVKALPVDTLNKISSIDKTGNLLLFENTLIIFNGQDIYGFDVTNPQNPEEVWNFNIEENNIFETARLYGDKIIFLTKTTLLNNNPCPIPLSGKDTSLLIECSDIYHPINPIPFDSVYTLMELDTKSGNLGKKVSFVGASSLSVSYFSNLNAYITYTKYEDLFVYMKDFFVSDGANLVDDSFLTKLKNVASLNISMQAKMTEFQVILEEYLQGMSADEVLTFRTDMENRLNEYSNKHIRDLESTSIVKIEVDDFTVKSVGSVPGKPLNQFSLDEYQDNFRIATTVGSGSMGGQSLNDLYILDNNLKLLGSLQGLGEDERIYSMRFVEDTAFMVTFKQIDPFFVIDLTNPKNPELTGELKIPGYSSYLHPLEKDLILGIGMEGNQVKASLFDVKNVNNPTETSNYQIDEYWTEVNDNHHAFLQDEKHKIFFVPGAKGGYIFSYQANEIILKKAISQIGVKRALFINDFLYIISDSEISVYDETNWEKVKSLSF